MVEGIGENRKFLSRHEMERLAREVLPDVKEFTTKEFKDHCRKIGIKESYGSNLLYRMKNSGMIYDIGKATDRVNGRLYRVKDIWFMT